MSVTKKQKKAKSIVERDLLKQVRSGKLTKSAAVLQLKAYVNSTAASIAA